MIDDDILVVIPARFRSTRLPGKPLIDIAGKPMIVRTAERCLQAVPQEQLVIATDDERIADVCRAHDLRVEMTRDDHPTGSDRVAEIAQRIPARRYINVQGDEPVFNPEDIVRIVEESSTTGQEVLIGYCEMPEWQWRDSKYIKLLFGQDRQLIYIGRAQVPGSHDGEFRFAYRQVCVSSYTRDALLQFHAAGARTPIESVEDHEVMRFLELGIPVGVVEMSADSMPVDRPEDVTLVESYLREFDGTNL